MLTEAWTETLAKIGLSHVSREFPNKLDHVLAGPEDALTPRVLHPVFFGSFDWHSCVHTYWMLARLLRRQPTVEACADICRLFDKSLVAEQVAGECAYFGRPQAAGFERPYGWAWLLALQAELQRHDAPWWEALRPLAVIVAERLTSFLPRATYPIRAGAHGNTAFALRLAADYAAGLDDPTLLALIGSTAWRWYGGDRDCQAWEPSGDDFLSSALVEAECMRRLLPENAFHAWFSAFVPALERGEPATLFRPAKVSDPTDGKIVHLHGLNLSRMWCWRALAQPFPPGHPIRIEAEAAADNHRPSLSALTGNYMGEHWLASFALLALDGL